MLSIPVNCNNKVCPVYNECCFLPTEISLSEESTVDILFVGQGGGKVERTLGRPFVGKSGKRLRQIIVYLRGKHNTRFGVAFSNTVRNQPTDNRAPEFDELEICMPFLYRDIKYLVNKYGLKCVMPLGNSSKNTIIPNDNLSILKTRGNLYHIDFPGLDKPLRVIPTFHPSFLIRKGVWNPENLNLYHKFAIEDIEKALNEIAAI